MTARSILWLALAAVGVPLLIEGTGGCSFQSPGAAPIDDNAYTCGCTCSSILRARNVAVSASSDDAEQSGATVTLDSPDLDLGAQIVGIRFPGFLPPGAVIKKAYVGFRARGNNDSATSLQIVGLLGHTVPTFSGTSNDISSRPATGTIIPWSPGAWTGGSYQQTPDLTALIQELVNQPNWSTKSAVVLRVQGTGQRAASSFDDSSFSPTLQVEYDPTMRTELPVCATPEIVAQNVNGRIPRYVAQADCQGRVATTLTSIAAVCGYAQDCSCDLVDSPKADATFDRDMCQMPCPPNELDSTCADFDPIGFERCVMQTGDDTACKSYVSATHAGDAAPVCVATGTGQPQDSPSTTSYLAFGHRSTCEVEGTSHIEVGDREPTHDPETVGTVQYLGDPCPGGGCRVAASFALAMDPVTFSVRWASDPTFSDLSASADSKATTMLTGVDAVFGPNGVGGTGNGRRGSNGLAVNAPNAAPLTVGIDWSGKACDLTGNLATAVDGENPDGTCAGDGATACTADSPDCDDVGGPCEFEEQDIEEMTVDVAASGTLVNQPPSAAAGPDQTVECTSTSGASFTLNGSASDPDDDIAVVSWRQGRAGAEVGQDPVSTQSLAVGVTQDFVLRLIDTHAQSDEDDVRVAVVDTTPPQLTVSLSPANLWSRNHKLATVQAMIGVADTCDGNPVVRLVSITSNEPDNGLGDGDKPEDIQGTTFGSDDREFQLRSERSGKGLGRVYTVTYSATDASGNTALSQATVKVPH